MMRHNPEIGDDNQVEDDSSSKRNIWWNREMDRCLTETLIKQIPIGQKSDRTFSRSAYLAVCDEMYAQLGEGLTVSHLKNRLKTLKKDLAVFHDMEISSSEFSFNRVTGGMDAMPSVWDMHIKAHPDAKQCRYKAVPTYENLCIIFGKERPARKHADEKCYPHWDPMEKGLYEKQGNHYPLEETVMEIYEESGGESMNASSMSKQAHNDPLSISIQKTASKGKYRHDFGLEGGQAFWLHIYYCSSMIFVIFFFKILKSMS